MNGIKTSEVRVHLEVLKVLENESVKELGRNIEKIRYGPHQRGRARQQVQEVALPVADPGLI